MDAGDHLDHQPGVNDPVDDSVNDLDYDKGTIRFQPERPLTDDTIRTIVAARIAEIDDPSLRRRT
ncbi:MAG: hypothetical protein QM695_05460 [Micropruina sp.]